MANTEQRVKRPALLLSIAFMIALGESGCFRIGFDLSSDDHPDGATELDGGGGFDGPNAFDASTADSDMDLDAASVDVEFTFDAADAADAAEATDADATDTADADVTRNDAGSDASVDIPLVLSDFRLGYVTPNSAMVLWSSVGEPAQFDRYEVWYGTDAASVDAQTPPAVAQSGQQDPGLTALSRPAQQRITRTILVGLTPSTHYFANLVGITREGGTEKVTHTDTAPIAFDTPPVPLRTLTLYQDAFLPSSWVLGESPSSDPASTTQNPHTGSESIEFVSTGAADGFVFHYGSLGIPRPPWSADEFAAAYLEFAIDCSSVIEYAEAWLSDDADNFAFFGWPDYFVCHSGWQIIQVPLSRMQPAGATDPILPDTLGSIDQMASWAPWPSGTQFIDDVVIRY